MTNSISAMNPASTVRNHPAYLSICNEYCAGDDELKAEYEERCKNFNLLHYWQNVQPYSLQVLSAKPWTITQPSPMAGTRKSVDGKPANRKQMEEERLGKVMGRTGGMPIKEKRTAAPEPELTEVDRQEHSPSRNPYEGDKMAKQLNETLEEFLGRLEPLTTTIESGPWIWVANPRTSNRHLYRNQPRFMDEGSGFLDVYMDRKRKLEKQNPELAPGTITRRLKPEREWLEESLFELAKKCSVTNGKWMLFPLPHQVDEFWGIVAKGTLDGRLGSAAKVATDAGDGKPERLICIYTEDFSDVKDVKRVLREMRRLGLVSSEKGAKWIYYKIDAYTYLGITSDNDYKLKASKYSSKDMLPAIDYETM